jgi:hypothetical protein
MNTERTRIRPRIRTAEPAPHNTLPPEEAVEKHSVSDDDLPGLQVLARLPEVAVPSDRTRLPLQLDWLKKLDWKRVRQVNLDPNWVAGGVLALVLLLLLVITLNRSPKPAADAAAESQAPSWNAGGKAAAPTTLSATHNIAAASPSNAPTNGAPVNTAPATGIVNAPTGVPPGPSYAVQPTVSSNAAAGPQGQFSLEGVFYPVTPFAPPVGIAAQPSLDHAVNQPNGSVYGRELRTAHRDVHVPHQPHVQPAAPQSAAPQSGRAQFEGIISQP